MKSLLRAGVMGLWIAGAWGCANTSGKSDSDVECAPGDDCDLRTNEQVGGSAGSAGSGGTGGRSGTGGSAGVSGTSGSGGASGIGGRGGGGIGAIGGQGGAEGGAGAGACRFQGTSVPDGQTFPFGCNECLCANGRVTCTDVECPPSDLCGADTCEVGDTCYADGSLGIPAPDGCSVCSCTDGTLYCNSDGCEEPPACPASSCEHLDTCHANGASNIPAGDGCNWCTCANGSLQCTLASCEPFDEPPCEAGSCEINGICYPLNETTEDGCCTCGAAGATCNDDPWCEGQNPVGTRCDVDGDCQPGLDCRGDLSGERQLCIRTCNYGCPTGTVCADSIPHFNGGFVANICMRTCMVSTDCAPFGSECDMPSGTDRRYCF